MRPARKIPPSVAHCLTIQEDLIKHFRNSSVLDQPAQNRPRLYYPPSAGAELAGQPEAWPGQFFGVTIYTILISLTLGPVR